MINTKFWSDGWVRKLNALERYLFLYLLTNEHTTISGIYELPLDLMAAESGIDKGDLEQAMLGKLEPKAFYVESYVVLPNFPKHQNLKSSNIVLGIQREFLALPRQFQEYVINTCKWGDGMHMAPDTKLEQKAKTNPSDAVVNALEKHKELTYKQLAEMTGRKEDTVKKLISRNLLLSKLVEIIPKGKGVVVRLREM